MLVGVVDEWNAGGFGKIKYLDCTDEEKKEKFIHVHYNNVEGHEKTKLTYELMKDAKVSFEKGKGYYDKYKDKQFPPQAINVKFINEKVEEDSEIHDNDMNVDDNLIQRVLDSPIPEICNTPITPPCSPFKLHKSEENKILTLQMQEFNLILQDYKSKIQRLEEENKIIKDSLDQTRTTMNLLVSNMDLMNRHSK